MLVVEDGGCGARLDYFECMFDKAFRTFYINCVRSELQIAKQNVPHPSAYAYHNNGMSDDEMLSRIARSETVRRPKLEDAVLHRVCLNDLFSPIDRLPTNVRTAVILCHMLDVPQESGDPSKITAANLCSVNGRTIRNRLSRAAIILSQFNPQI